MDISTLGAPLPIHVSVDGTCSCDKPDCLHPGKHPIFQYGRPADWKPKDYEISGWHKRWPWANVGVVPAPGYLVTDIDDEAAWQEFVAGRDVPATLEMRSGRGRHLWWRVPEGRTFSTNGHQGFDLRSHTTGYAIVPESLHPNGSRYAWVDEDAPIADAPAWLITDLTARTAEQYVSPDGELAETLAEIAGRHADRSSAIRAFALHCAYAPYPFEDFAAAVGSHPELASKLNGRRDDYLQKQYREACASARQSPHDQRGILNGTTIATSAPQSQDHAWSGVVTPSKGRQVLLEDADGEIAAVEWWWADRLPLGALALLGGREGIGKSLLAYWLCAQLTRGTLRGCFQGRPMTVIISAAEDSWKHTIRPRLRAAGADMSKVKRARVRSERFDDLDLNLPEDTEALRRAITERDDVALLLLDPLISRLDSGIDTHKDAEVRQALEPIAKLADECNIGVLGLIHVNKGTTSDPLTSLMASRAFAAVARAVIYAIVEKETGKRYVGQAKNNLGRDDVASMEYGIATAYVGDDPKGKRVDAPYLKWKGEDRRAIGEIMAANNAPPPKQTKEAEAADWLKNLLVNAGGEMARADIVDQALAFGYNDKLVSRARERAGIEIRNTHEVPRKTYWYLPGTQLSNDEGAQ